MQNQEHAMGTSPIFGLLMKMSIPPMVSMLIQSLYNIVDSVFVAQLSEDAPYRGKPGVFRCKIWCWPLR